MRHPRPSDGDVPRSLVPAHLRARKREVPRLAWIQARAMCLVQRPGWLNVCAAAPVWVGCAPILLADAADGRLARHSIKEGTALVQLRGAHHSPTATVLLVAGTLLEVGVILLLAGVITVMATVSTHGRLHGWDVFTWACEALMLLLIAALAVVSVPALVDLARTPWKYRRIKVPAPVWDMVGFSARPFRKGCGTALMEPLLSALADSSSTSGVRGTLRATSRTKALADIYERHLGAAGRRGKFFAVALPLAQEPHLARHVSTSDDAGSTKRVIDLRDHLTADARAATSITPERPARHRENPGLDETSRESSGDGQ